MKTEKGILTKKVESLLAKKLDELIKLPNYLEPFDCIAFRIAIKSIDDSLGEKIPEEFRLELREQIELILLEKDYEKAVIQASVFIDRLVDIPGLDDATEAKIFAGLANIVIGLLLHK